MNYNVCWPLKSSKICTILTEGNNRGSGDAVLRVGAGYYILHGLEKLIMLSKFCEAQLLN